jgi:hypothetical protein
MNLKLHRAISGFVLITALILMTSCAGNSNPAPPAPTPTPAVTTFSISGLSPATVSEGQVLEISYTGPAPGQSTNPVTALFVQGTLPSKQGQLVNFDSLGNNSYNVFFKVPSGFATDAGIVPIDSTVTLSNGLGASAAQKISIAPPPSLVLFPEELYVGDTATSVRLHGNNAHFDQSTVVTASAGLQIVSTTVISSTDLVITANVISAAATSGTLTVSSGGSDPRKSEVLASPIPIAVSPSPLIGASGLSVVNAPPGTVIQVQGLFQPPDGTDHNTVQWSVGGQAIAVQSFRETSGTLSVMVPLWPNPDGSIYSGPAQVTVRASGQSAQFNFNIDPLPANTLARGAVVTAVLDAVIGSIAQLQTTATSVDSSAQTQAVFQAVSDASNSMITQLRQFVASEAAGIPAIPPAGTQPLSLQQFDLMEQLLLSSGVVSKVQALVANQRTSSISNAALLDTTMVAATAFCRATSTVTDLITELEAIDIEAALLAAASSIVTGPVGLLVAADLISATGFLEGMSDAAGVLGVVCSALPINLTQVTFLPPAYDFTNTTQQRNITSLTGSFRGCIDPVPTLASFFEGKLKDKLKPVYKILPIGSLLDQIVKKAVTFLAGQVLDIATGFLQSHLQQMLRIPLTLQTPGPDIALTPATVALFSANPSVVIPFVTGPSMNVQPINTGATFIWADLSAFNLIPNPNISCDATINSLDIPGDTAQVTVNGPPLVIPTNSGGSTGIIPGTLAGKPIDKAYVAVPGSGVVSVLNADAAAGAPPITTIPMPIGFSPSATAANPVSSTVFVISYTSANVAVIDASTDTLLPAPISLSVLKTANFSGGACIVCGVVADPIANQVIFDTADGYQIFDISSNRIVQTFTVAPAENFGYNPLTRQILSPFYDAFPTPISFGLNSLDLGLNSSLLFSGSVGATPDAAAVDYTTNIGIVANEAEFVPIGFITLLNLGAAQSASPNFSAPAATFQFPDATGLCSGGGNQAEWTMLAVDPANHLLFTANEFSDCAGVLDLPPTLSTGIPRTASRFRFGEMPVSPDGLLWDNSHDPHGNAVFTSVVDGRSYGFLVRLDGHFIARIDLQNFFNASVLANTPGAVDMAPLVTYLPTLLP